MCHGQGSAANRGSACCGGSPHADGRWRESTLSTGRPSSGGVCEPAPEGHAPLAGPGTTRHAPRSGVPTFPAKYPPHFVTSGSRRPAYQHKRKDPREVGYPLFPRSTHPARTTHPTLYGADLARWTAWAWPSPASGLGGVRDGTGPRTVMRSATTRGDDCRLGLPNASGRPWKVATALRARWGVVGLVV